jgi:hypothetical protein
MLRTPVRPEIDEHVSKLIVGVIAVSLPALTYWFATSPLESISESYYHGGWSQSFLIGFLYAIAAFLLAYNGKSIKEMVASKCACVAALGVAMFPCQCGTHPEVVPYVHGASAALMFLTLAYFCYLFYDSAINKPRQRYPLAKARAVIYAACGVALLIFIAILAFDALSGNAYSTGNALVFYGEAGALVAFGISWLTASRTLPVITQKHERIPLRPGTPIPPEKKAA